MFLTGLYFHLFSWIVRKGRITAGRSEINDHTYAELQPSQTVFTVAPHALPFPLFMTLSGMLSPTHSAKANPIPGLQCHLLEKPFTPRWPLSLPSLFSLRAKLLSLFYLCGLIMCGPAFQFLGLILWELSYSCLISHSILNTGSHKDLCIKTVVVQWLGLCLNAGIVSSISQGAKIPYASGPKTIHQTEAIKRNKLIQSLVRWRNLESVIQSEEEEEENKYRIFVHIYGI